MSGHGSAPVCSKKAIRKLMDQILSPNKQTSEAAERNLGLLEAFDEFGIYLIEIIADANYPLAVRQLAAKRLKEYAEIHFCWWSGTSKLIKFEIKERIIRLSFLALEESNFQIRNVVASVISTIADRLQNYSSLFDASLNCLRGENKFAVDGALRVLCSLRFDDDVRLSDILQETYRIFEAENQYSVKVRAHAVTVFNKVIYRCDAGFAQEYFQPLASMFCRKFIQHLSIQNYVSSDSYGLKTEIIKAIITMMKPLAKCVSDFLPEILPLIWKILIDRAKVYEGDSVNESTDIEDAETDSDGKIINESDNLVHTILDFIYAFMDNDETCEYSSSHSEYTQQDYHWISLQDSLSSPEVLHYLIHFMKITDTEIALWTDDPGKLLVQEEPHLAYPDSLRDLTREIAISDSILSYPTRAAATALVVVILKQMETECMMRINPNSEISQNRWKFHEAFLLAFCLAKDIIATKLNEGTIEFDLVAFLKNVVLVDLDNPESHTLLKCRCVRLGGLYAEQIPPELASSFLKATANALQNQSPCLKICAAIAAKHWLQAAATEGNEGCKKILKPHLPALFEGLFNLVQQLDVKHLIDLVMESVYLMALFHKAFTTSVLGKMYTLTVAAYNKSYDSKTVSVCNIFFKKFTSNPKYTGMLQRSLVPKLIGSFRFDVADILIRHSPKPLSKLLIESLFPALCKNILSKERWTCLDEEGKVICTYLSVAAQQVISYNDGDGKTGQQYVLEVAAQVSNVKRGDSESSVAHEIVTLLLRNAGNGLSVAGSDLQFLLTAFPSKVGITPRQSILRRYLLLVWAQLINTRINPVLNFLTAIYCSGRVGVARVSEIFHGFCAEYAFFENAECKTVTQALCKILKHGIAHQKSWLHDIVIKETEEGETTTVPLLLQICKFITTQFSRQIEELDKD